MFLPTTIKPPAPLYFRLVVSSLLLSRREALGNPETYQAHGDNANNGEYENDTSFLLRPVLTLGNGAEGVACDDGGVDGRHFEG
jgi:hypothetical protein